MTSGIAYYQLTRDQLTTAAMRKLGVIAQGQTPSADDLTNAAMALNMAVAELRALGMPLWKRTSYSWTPTTGQYSIGTGYTINSTAPLRVYQAYRVDSGSTAKIPMDVIGLEDYNRLPTTPGSPPIKLNYDPKVNYGYINLWPQPDSTNTASVTIVYQVPYDYFNASTDTMDFPEEWYNAIVYKTAVLIAPEWGIPLPDRQLLIKEMQMYVDSAATVSQEDGSIYFQPERDRW